MKTLLHIKASPRGERSHSNTTANRFITALQDRGADVQVKELDVWQADLPSFDGALLAAKYARLAGRAFSIDEAQAWARIEALVSDLEASDMVLISSPMWNLSIPYRLKHYIDLITQPGLSFTFDPETGYTPLLSPRPVVAIMASSGDFSEGPSWGRPDLASPYIRQALKFIGLVDAEVVAVGPTVGRPAKVTAAAERAGETLDGLAERLSSAMA